MKCLLNHVVLSLLLVGIILIIGCNRSEGPTAPERTVTDVGRSSLQKSGSTIAPGVVSWWPGDGNANDIIGGNNGTVQNGATFGGGLVGQAFSFDRIDDLVLVPDNANLNFGKEDDFTIDAWINLQNPVSSHDDEIVNKTKHAPDGFSNGYAFRVFRSTRQLFFRLVRDNGFTSFDLLSNSTITLNEWTHVTAVRQGNMGLLYINGALDASAQLTDESVANSWPLSIGGLYDTRFSPPVQRDHVFGGLIDEVEIYNRALTTTEIQAIFKAGSRGNKPTKQVTICHKPGTPAEKTLVIPFQALASHQGHGDTIGACE